MNATTAHYESAAHLTASLQVPFSKVARAIELLKLTPALVLNGIGHYSESQCSAIAEEITASKR